MPIVFKKRMCHSIIEKYFDEYLPYFIKGFKWPIIFFFLGYTVFVVAWMSAQGIEMAELGTGYTYSEDH